MANKRSPKKTFNGMSYAKVQRANSTNRSKLAKEKQTWLKENGYKNVGWKNVSNLYQKIEELSRQTEIENMSLEELFLEADQIGNKYLTDNEKQEFNQKLLKETDEIAEIIDQQFPDTEIEIVDYSNQTNKKSQKKHNQKTYRTTKS